MSVVIKVNDVDTIEISESALADLIGMSVVENIGVVGMVSKSKVKDGVSQLLKKENFSKGVVIDFADNELIIDVHIVVSFGVNIIEVCKNVQKNVRLHLLETNGIGVNSINIHVDDIRNNS